MENYVTDKNGKMSFSKIAGENSVNMKDVQLNKNLYKMYKTQLINNIIQNNRLFLFFILITFFSFPLFGQENEYITVQAQHIKTISTGKCHNSYFFIFRINNVIEGQENDSVIVSQEIYHDFGGQQTISKFRKGEVILKYIPIDMIDNTYYPENRVGPYKKVKLIWVTELERKYSLKKLEKILKGYNITYLNLLEENNGKFFFNDGNKRKVAVETQSRYWIIATVDKE